MGRPGRRWITRSSNRGIRPWSSSCGGSSTSRPRRPPGPGSRPGSRTTTTAGGTPRWARSARWITSGRWRERTPRDRGPAAARPRTRRRRLRRRLSSPGCRAPAGGRAARGYGAAPPASRLLRTAARRPAAGPDPGDLCGPSGRKYGQAPACPAGGAARPGGPCPAHKRTPGTKGELAFDSQKKDRNYKNPLSVSVHGSRGLPRRSVTAASAGATSAASPDDRG